jgi:hypothetical protein
METTNIRLQIESESESHRTAEIVIFPGRAGAAEPLNIVRGVSGIITKPSGPSQATEAIAMPSADVATIGKVASASVFFISASSFLLGLLTGFYAIFPPMSLLACGMSAVMYALSVRLKKQWKK